MYKEDAVGWKVKIQTLSADKGKLTPLSEILNSWAFSSVWKYEGIKINNSVFLFVERGIEL